MLSILPITYSPHTVVCLIQQRRSDKSLAHITAACLQFSGGSYLIKGLILEYLTTFKTNVKNTTNTKTFTHCEPTFSCTEHSGSKSALLCLYMADGEPARVATQNK